MLHPRCPLILPSVIVSKCSSKAERSTVVFMTANPKRIPDHFAGAVGVIAKPYTMQGLTAALRYLQEGVRRPPPATPRPVGFTLSPSYQFAWDAATG